MSNVAIHKAKSEDSHFPIFSELSKRFDQDRQLAFKFFEERGCTTGHELEDWFKAEREILGPVMSELTDKGNAYEVQVALPGFEIKDVSVTSTLEAIIVHAASKKENKSQKGDVIWTEFGSNEIYRRFAIPNTIDVDKTTASLEKGILRINAPKAPSSPKEKNISVKAACAVIRKRKDSLLRNNFSLLWTTSRPGAQMGNLFLSLIHTCELSGVKPFDYLTELRRHAADLAQNAPAWMAAKRVPQQQFVRGANFTGEERKSVSSRGSSRRC